MTKLYWVNFLHFYQPPFLSPALLKIIIKESYEFILKHLEKYPNRKLTLNISGSLTEHLKKEDQSVLNRLKKLVVDGQVELVSSAKYHPILPLLPLMEVKRQIKLHDDINRAVFGAAYQPTGFYLPEMAYSRPVAELLGERLWNTVILVMGGQILAIVLGIGLGLVAAWKNKTSFDTAAITFSLAAWSLPTFWLGILLLIIGSIYLGLPTAGRETVGMEFASGWAQALDIGRHLLLPTLTFTIVLLGEYMLIMRSSVLEILTEDYILTAKAKGLSHFQILRKHALPNAMLPIVTLIALNLGFTVSGAIQVETVFSWPGLGSMIYEAVRRQDYPVLQGAFLLVAVSVVLANLVADLVYGVLDPRVKAP